LIIDYMVGLGLDIVNDKIKDAREEKIVRDRLQEYIERQAKINLHSSREEEIDFGGLMEYIQSDLIDDVNVRIFGSRRDRGIARTNIINHAIAYSQKCSALSRERAIKLTETAVDILYDYYRSKVNRDCLFIAQQIEDTVIEAVEGSEQRLVEHINQVAAANSQYSLEQNMTLMRSGEISQVEAITASWFDAISASHKLFPDYCFAYKGDTRQYYSKPLSADALKKYPPKISCTGTIQVNGQYVDKLDCGTIAYANRHQLPITLNVLTARKFLGAVDDPVQHEAEDLVGKSLIIPPRPFPPAFPCSISVDGVVAFDYILFRTQEILDDGTAVISNSEQQNCPYRIAMSVHMERTNTTYSINIEDPNNMELLTYLRFLKQAAKGGEITIKVLSTGEEFAKGRLGKLDLKAGFGSVESELEFLERVVCIEQHFETHIDLPEEIMEEDFRTIAYASTLLQGKESTGSWSGLEFTVPLTAELKERLLESDSNEFILTYVGTISLSIYNHDFELQVMRQFDSVTYRDLDRLKQKAAVLDTGDSITIRFIPGEGDSGTWRDRIADEI